MDDRNEIFWNRRRNPTIKRAEDRVLKIQEEYEKIEVEFKKQEIEVGKHQQFRDLIRRELRKVKKDKKIKRDGAIQRHDTVMKSLYYKHIQKGKLSYFDIKNVIGERESILEDI